VHGLRRPLTGADLEPLLPSATDVSAAVAAYLEHRRDVFAPPSLPVTVRVAAIAALGGRLLAVDAAGHGVHLAATPHLERSLEGALRDATLELLLGDVGSEGVLVQLHAHAAVVRRDLVQGDLVRGDLVRGDLVRRDGALELVPLGALEGPALGGKPQPWLEVAREAGLSPAAISLAEVRRELAQLLATGLGGLAPRPLLAATARLRDLRLGKLAELLDAVPAEPDPEKRAGAFVKAQQLLDMALLRLASTTRVDLAALSPVPGMESLRIHEPEDPLPPAQVAAERAAGRLSVYEAAWHYGRHYREVGAERLARDLATWGDGSARPYVVSALAAQPELALAAARRVLATPCGRAAQGTAVALLERLGTGAAERALEEAVHAKAAEGLRFRITAAHLALRARHDRGSASRTFDRQAAVEGELRQLAEGGDLETRRAAAARLLELGSLAALPALRRAFFDDAATAVRQEAAHALGTLGDVDMTDTLLSRLRERTHGEVKVALRTLGLLGDLRAFPALLHDYVQGASPQVAAEALGGFGVLAVAPLLDFVAGSPEHGKREALRGVLAGAPHDVVAAAAIAQLEARVSGDGFVEEAKGILRLAEGCKGAAGPVSRRLLALTEGDARKGIKTLRKVAEGVAAEAK
jgi:hypothetical protein